MKTILFVCPTHDIARTEFNECINRLTCQLTTHNINHSKMQIVFDSAMYEFTSADDSLLQRVIGRTFSYIMIDEMVKLTEEVKSILMTRIEKTYQDQRDELHVVNQILEDLRGYSGVGEDGNPYDTTSWNAALKAVRDIIKVRLAHDIDKKTILELIQQAHQEARDTVGYYNDDYEAIFQEKLVDISVRYGMSIKRETLPE